MSSCTSITPVCDLVLNADNTEQCPTGCDFSPSVAPNCNGLTNLGICSNGDVDINESDCYDSQPTWDAGGCYDTSGSARVPVPGMNIDLCQAHTWLDGECSSTDARFASEGDCTRSRIWVEPACSDGSIETQEACEQTLSWQVYECNLDSEGECPSGCPLTPGSDATCTGIAQTVVECENSDSSSTNYSNPSYDGSFDLSFKYIAGIFLIFFLFISFMGFITPGESK